MKSISLLFAMTLLFSLTANAMLYKGQLTKITRTAQGVSIESNCLAAKPVMNQKEFCRTMKEWNPNYKCLASSLKNNCISKNTDILRINKNNPKFDQILTKAQNALNNKINATFDVSLEASKNNQNVFKVNSINLK
jgi:hypothetical protein